MTPRAALDQGLGKLALTLPQRACEQLIAYVELLAKWNQTYNLTAIRDPLKMVTHHVLDSLAVLPHLPMSEEGTLADAGSGAGLPGIAIAIARPAWHVTLNDASDKKAAFLRQAAIELSLDNVGVHHGRVESWKPPHPFSVVISRAFAELARFIASCRHLVGASGTIAAMKGAFPQAELSSLPGDCDCSHVVRLSVPFLDAERHLVLCRFSA